MKFIILLGLILAIQAVHSYRPTASLDDEWEKFKTNFNKSYTSAEEEARRKAIFERTLNGIIAHNQKYDNKEVSFSQGINHFADLEVHEVPTGYIHRKTRNNDNE